MELEGGRGGRTIGVGGRRDSSRILGLQPLEMRCPELERRALLVKVLVSAVHRLNPRRLSVAGSTRSAWWLNLKYH